MLTHTCTALLQEQCHLLLLLLPLLLLLLPLLLLLLPLLLLLLVCSHLPCCHY
jgi:hypothetical protein